MDKNVLDKIYQIIEKIVNINPADIDPEKELRDQIMLDSMQFVTLSAHLEEEFKIELPISIMEVKTFNEFLYVFEKELYRKNN